MNMTINSLREEMEDAVREDLKFYLSGDADMDNLHDIAIDAHHAVMDNMVTYTSTCQEIVEVCRFDVFSDDNVLGERPNSIEQSAYIALMEVGIDTDEIIEEVVEEYNKL